MTEDSKYTRQTVTSVHTWVPGKLFSVRVTRATTISNPEFRPPDDPRPFALDGVGARPALAGVLSIVVPEGLFSPRMARLAPGDALYVEKAPLWLPMVSAPGQPWLEFYSIVVPEGLFSPRMARLAPGDALYVEKAPYGFLTLERFAPGGDLWLLASGTGLSAYLSILRDPRSGTPTAASSGARRPYRRRAGLPRGNQSLARRPDLASHFAADPRKLVPGRRDRRMVFSGASDTLATGWPLQRTIFMTICSGSRGR